MKKRLDFHLHHLALSLVAAVFLLAAAPRVCADTPAVIISGEPRNSVSNPTTTFGWAFTLANPVIVTQLGFLPEAFPTNNPSTEDTPVGIWNSVGVLLCMAIVPAGAAANTFDYVSLTVPTLLAPGDYTIGAYTASGNDATACNVSSITPAAGITYNGTRSVVASGLTFPSGSAFNFDANGDFGPNFQFADVPEPSTWAMMLGGVGFLSLVHNGLKARRRRGDGD